MTKYSRIGQLAGILVEKKLSSVKAKWSPPEGFFTNSAAEIVKGLLAAPGGQAKAMARLNFYINRAGKNLSAEDKARLEKAKAKLQAMKEEAETFANLAGVVLEKKAKDDDDPEMEMDDNPKDEPKDKKKDEDEEEETLPKIVLKIAKKAVGKDEEELADLLMKVYDAGFKDGVKSTEEDDEKPKKDKDDEVSEAAVLESVRSALEKFMDANKIHSFEGEHGGANLVKIIKAIGYRDLRDFLADNPGALEAIVDWIGSQRVSEWEKSLGGELDEARFSQSGGMSKDRFSQSGGMSKDRVRALQSQAHKERTEPAYVAARRKVKYVDGSGWYAYESDKVVSGPHKTAGEAEEAFYTPELKAHK